jgi:hypothetical protein
MTRRLVAACRDMRRLAWVVEVRRVGRQRRYRGGGRRKEKGRGDRGARNSKR